MHDAVVARQLFPVRGTLSVFFLPKQLQLGGELCLERTHLQRLHAVGRLSSGVALQPLHLGGTVGVQRLRAHHQLLELRAVALVEHIDGAAEGLADAGDVAVRVVDIEVELVDSRQEVGAAEAGHDVDEDSAVSGKMSLGLLDHQASMGRGPT